MAPSYPQFYGGSAQVPSRDADFEAWHGPVNVVPQQQQQQQQPGLLPAPGFQLPAPSFASTLGMPELPPPSGSQVRPPAIMVVGCSCTVPMSAYTRSEPFAALRAYSLLPSMLSVCWRSTSCHACLLASSARMPPEHPPLVANNPSHDDPVHACRASRVTCSSMTRAIAPWTRRGRSPVLAAACRLAQEPNRSSQASAHRCPLVSCFMFVTRPVWPLSYRAPRTMTSGNTSCYV